MLGRVPDRGHDVVEDQSAAAMLCQRDSSAGATAAALQRFVGAIFAPQNAGMLEQEGTTPLAVVAPPTVRYSGPNAATVRVAAAPGFYFLPLFREGGTWKPCPPTTP
jgi:hypothetical protein